jgi:hypothetical protein
VFALTADVEMREKTEGWLGQPLIIKVIAALALIFIAGYLLGQPSIVAAVRTNQLDLQWLLVIPGGFSIFVVLLVIYLIAASLKNGFFSGNSLLQIGAALALLSLVSTNTLSEYKARNSLGASGFSVLESLAKSRDARVRALVMEVCSHRDMPKPKLMDILKAGLDDPDPMVVSAAINAIEKKSEMVFAGPNASTNAMKWLSKQTQINENPQ